EGLIKGNLINFASFLFLFGSSLALLDGSKHDLLLLDIRNYLLVADRIMEAERILFLGAGQLDEQVAQDRRIVVDLGIDAHGLFRQSLEAHPAEVGRAELAVLTLDMLLYFIGEFETLRCLFADDL